jgi:hypothetical protein
LKSRTSTAVPAAFAFSAAALRAEKLGRTAAAGTVDWADVVIRTVR